MIKLDALCDFIAGSFDYLLVVNQEESVLHSSQFLDRYIDPDGGPFVGLSLEQVLSPSSLASFRSGMNLSREGSGVTVVFSPLADPSRSLPMRAGHIVRENEGIFLFFCSQVDGLGTTAEWEKDERVKELSCIYAVAEWIEVSPSISEFFTKLGPLLGSGMRFPDKTAVHSVYLGEDYGEKPAGDKAISAKLTVNNQEAGVITVGYQDVALELLPEEQRMLDQICRILSLALERRELAERLALKQGEEEEFNLRLADLNRKIEFTANELEGRKRQLSQVEAYRDRVSRGLDEAKGWMETIFEAIPSDVALIDRKHNLLLTNRGEKGQEQEQGGKCYKAIFDRETPCENCRLARIVQCKAPVSVTVEHDERFLEVHAIPIYDDAHEVDGIMEFYRDVTLEKTYEQQLRQADQLASLGQLVSGIGHEINNPNQFIRGNIQILKQALDDMLPIVDAYQKEHPELKIARLNYDFFREHIMVLVNDMAHGSERIKGIVEGLRRFARRDEGLLVDNVDVNTLIQDCVRLVHNEVHKRAEVELDLQPEIPSFTGNSQQIEQVLINLIVNASHAMADDIKGLIKINTRREDDRVVMQIYDNGKGMNEKTLKQIFDPFFTTKRAKGGTGLGLPIAYRIIEEHKGTITVQSKPGEGTTFTVSLPGAVDKGEDSASEEEQKS